MLTGEAIQLLQNLEGILDPGCLLITTEQRDNLVAMLQITEEQLEECPFDCDYCRSDDGD